MKKILTAVLVSACMTMPAMAAGTAPTMSGKKAVSGQPDKCDARHDMGAAGHGRMMGGGGMMGGMMGGGYGGSMMGRGSDMMPEPDMHMLEMLSLSKEQRASINKISDELKHNNWTTQGLMNDETARLRDLYQADKRDPSAIDGEYQKVFDLKRQMIRAYLEAENKIEDVLTAEQRTKLKEARSQMHRMYMH